jgi:hypothetical protein
MTGATILQVRDLNMQFVMAAECNTTVAVRLIMSHSDVHRRNTGIVGESGSKDDAMLQYHAHPRPHQWFSLQPSNRRMRSSCRLRLQVLCRMRLALLAGTFTVAELRLRVELVGQCLQNGSCRARYYLIAADLKKSICSRVSGCGERNVFCGQRQRACIMHWQPVRN